MNVTQCCSVALSRGGWYIAVTGFEQQMAMHAGMSHPVPAVLRNGISRLVAQKVKAEFCFLKVQLLQQPVSPSQEEGRGLDSTIRSGAANSTPTLTGATASSPSLDQAPSLKSFS